MTQVEQQRYRILGGPGSPYSLKLRAAFRSRRIPHNWIVPPGYLGTAGELKAAGKGMIPVLQTPEGSYWADSTPIILNLEDRHPGQRSLLPDDPADRFLSLLLEDLADEWLVLCLFDFRWDAEQDQAFCARRQIAGWLGAMPSEQFSQIVEQFRVRQTGVLARMGCPRQITDAELKAIRNIAKDSQKSLRPVGKALARRIRSAVQAQISAADVEGLLAHRDAAISPPR